MDVPDIDVRPFRRLASVLVSPLDLLDTTTTRSASQTPTELELLTSPSLLNWRNMGSSHFHEHDETIKQEYLTAVPDIGSRQRASLEINYRH